MDRGAWWATVHRVAKIPELRTAALKVCGTNKDEKVDVCYSVKP